MEEEVMCNCSDRAEALLWLLNSGKLNKVIDKFNEKFPDQSFHKTILDAAAWIDVYEEGQADTIADFCESVSFVQYLADTLALDEFGDEVEED